MYYIHGVRAVTVEANRLCVLFDSEFRTEIRGGDKNDNGACALPASTARASEYRTIKSFNTHWPCVYGADGGIQNSQSTHDSTQVRSQGTQ